MQDQFTERNVRVILEALALLERITDCKEHKHNGIGHSLHRLPAGRPEQLAPTLAATARAAEQGGATMFTLADHFFQMENIGRAEDPFLEGYTSLGFLAGQTSTIELDDARHRA